VREEAMVNQPYEFIFEVLQVATYVTTISQRHRQTDGQTC